jgi:hypothetical protein
MSALYWTSTLSWIVISVAHREKGPQEHTSLHNSELVSFRFVACVSCLVLSVLATIDDLAIELLSNIVMYIVSTLFAK